MPLAAPALHWLQRTALLVAVIVDALLNPINQGDALLGGGLLNWLRIALTYAAPLCVATNGAYRVSRVVRSRI